MTHHFITPNRACGATLTLAACLGFSQVASAADTAAGNLTVTEGFHVEQLYHVPKDSQGSWVSMTFDPEGRMIVSDQYGSLYRLVLPAIGSEDPVQVERIELEIGRAQGLLHAFDSLYVMVAEEAFEGRGLYRVRDTDGDDQYDDVKLLRKLEGGGEHGPHAIVLSPDGLSLTIVIGNQTRLTELAATKVPLHWGEDHLIPRMWDGNGFMAGVLAPGGCIYRIDPDGKNWTLISNGFRNEYDAAYNRLGDLFTYDADMEWDLNAPWYRPTRVNHVTSGSEFGWRSGQGKWPAYYADSLPAVVDVGPGSPTGVTFGYGAKFPAKYQNAFYIADWSYGKLYAVHMEPDGASYTGEVEEFIAGQPLPLTDLEVNPKDGALYFAVGGRRTQSALYRVTYVGDESTKLVESTPKAGRAAALRRELERFHGGYVKPVGDMAAEAVLRDMYADRAEQAVELAWKHLDHDDRYVRFAARIALEWQDVDLWRQRALTEKNTAKLVPAIMALARTSGRDVPHRVDSYKAPDPALIGQALEALGRVDWSALDEQGRLDLLRAYTLAFTRLGDPSPAHRRALIERFQPVFPTEATNVDIELATLLTYLDAPRTAELLVAKLEAAPTQEEQIDYARILRVVDAGWTPELRRRYFDWFVQSANFKGGASLANSIRNIKEEATARLSGAQKESLKDVLEAKVEVKNPMEVLAARTFVKEWTVAELAPAVSGGMRGRDFENGRKLFSATACYSCHRFAGQGGAVGPDLTGVAGRFSPRDLLESIIEPGKEISDQYGAIVIVKNDGDIVSGRVANLSGDTLSIIENMMDPGNMTRVNRGDVKSTQPSTVSMMPSGLLDTLTEEDVKDLMAYLLSGGDRDDKMFK